MSSNKLTLKEANPFSDDYEQLLDFTKKMQCDKTGIDYLLNIREQYNEDEYKKLKLKENRLINILILYENEMIKDYVYYQAEKDRKTVTIEFLGIQKTYRTRPLIDLAIDYLTIHYDMITVFLLQKKEDKSLGNILTKKNLESLGEEFGFMVYLIDHHIKQERENIICTV